MTDIAVGLMVFGVALALVSFGNAWDRGREARQVRRERELMERVIKRRLESYWMREQ